MTNGLRARLGCGAQTVQCEGGAIKRRVVGGPSFQPTLKRSTVPVEFRFELAGRLGSSRGSTAKEKPGARKANGNSRKRPKVDELEGAKSEPLSSRLRETEDDHHDQTGSHASAWKGKTRSNSYATSMGRSKTRTPLIVPGEFRFSTEQRARDRERFEEGVRVKQKEREDQLEHDRAARAVAEEREIKEMRRRAVPKANAVPGWYATMPKRKVG